MEMKYFIIIEMPFSQKYIGLSFFSSFSMQHQMIWVKPLEGNTKKEFFRCNLTVFLSVST
jgi:hypothetical protein